MQGVILNNIFCYLGQNYLLFLQKKTLLLPTLDKALANGRATAHAVSRWLPTAAARVRARSGHVGFVVDKVALGQVSSEYFGFPYQS
jgi:hypothetical protein